MAFDEGRYLDDLLRRLDSAHRIMAAQNLCLARCRQTLLRAKLVVHEAPVVAAIDAAIAEIVS